MCGICGYINLDGSPVTDDGTLETMCSAIVHRGPDDRGMLIDGPVAIGMQRLAIIDIVGGHQPIHNEDKGVWVVFNGEIYNYPELRRDMEQRGHRFYTKSDTEVLVHIYEEYGDDCVNRLNAMAAMALWDRKSQRLLLARDRLGKKPLYYTITGNTFVFGSEIKSLFRYPGVSRKVNLDALSKYLAYDYVPSPLSIVDGVQKLMPGHRLAIENGRFKTERYWSLLFTPKQGTQISEEDLAEEFLSRLRQSVQRRLMSDVPLGVFLSGGLDSSTITALLSELSPGKVKSFSIGFIEKSFDESSYARMVADRLGTNHHEFVMKEQEAIDLIPTLARVMDEPLGDGSLLPTYWLSKHTRRHVTVALSGEGGDELFCGYPTYIAHRLADIYTLLPRGIMKRTIEPLLWHLPVSTANFSLDFKIKKFLSGLEYPPDIRHQIWMGTFGPEEQRKLFQPDIYSRIKSENLYSEVARAIESGMPETRVDMVSCLDTALYLPEDLLVKADRASMACSLELRAPLLDYTLAEFIASLPSDLKFRGFTTKYLYKKAVKNILPKEIVHRKKKGFGIPIAKWIKKDLKNMFQETLAPDKIKTEGFFRPEYVQRLLQEHLEGSKDNRKQLWTLFMFELWLKEYGRPF